MDTQVLINILIGIGAAVLGWLWKTLWNSVERMKQDVKELEVRLPEIYVQKIDLERRFDKLDAALERIYEKLEAKQDKQGH